MFYDMHTHTSFSHDSGQDPEGSVLTAIQKGLSGIAFTDHADMWYYSERNTLEHIVSSVNAAAELGERYGDKIKVFRGIEVGDAYFEPAVTEELIRRISPDAVIGSIHCLSHAGLSDAYSCISFDDAVIPRENIVSLMKRYLVLVTDIAENHDIDILAHLTCPFRYINGKYRRGLTDEEFEKPIRRILDAVISRNIALEVNTSGLDTAMSATMPSEKVLSWYREMGGTLITLGSDAHSADRLANGFKETAEMLKRLGFTHCAYYENRRPKLYSI